MLFRAIILLTAFAAGCTDQKFDDWRGSCNFNGVEIVLPDNGLGSTGVSPKHFEYRWDDKTLTVKDLGDGTVSVSTPLVNDEIVSKELVVVIDAEGQISTQKPKLKNENQKTQQVGTANRDNAGSCSQDH